ncbi:MAG TPA: hypothetical protein VNW97_22440, partial [Candidatus Saccharimonadales bacterium]|nr:hypothetical protein [Candidatus Saccharimonadales bacterium]
MTYFGDEMVWEVEFSDEFGEWWEGLDAAEQKSVDFTVTLLSEAGPTLKMPHSSGIETSRHQHLRREAVMARNYKELQAKMNPADVAENKRRVREELQRMALDELRNAKQL